MRSAEARCGSNFTSARPRARFTLTSSTPATESAAFSTWDTHEAQSMPPTSNASSFACACSAIPTRCFILCFVLVKYALLPYLMCTLAMAAPATQKAEDYSQTLERLRGTAPGMVAAVVRGDHIVLLGAAGTRAR